MGRLFPLLRAFWSLTWGLFWVTFLHHFFKRRPSGAWVIGGHRGRHYGDNSAAVEACARAQGRNIIWIANPELASELNKKGVEVLARQSWAARKAISRASLLIYSHGEDDLDLQLILLRGRTAPRVYLDHCMCMLKAGGLTDPTLKRALLPVRLFRTWLITRWDYVLCVSEEVRQNFRECYAMNPLGEGRARLHGGAHLDEWQPGLTLPPEKLLYWFPTFRETPSARRRLRSMIEAVISNERLSKWLVESDRKLLIGTHINDGKPELDLKPPFFSAQSSQLVSDLRRAELLISDYSGVVYDFLLLERPTILFAFDLEDYTKRRHLFGDYQARDFALHATSVDELVDTITTERWKSDALRLAASRARARSLPPETKSYAELSVRELAAIEAEEAR